MTRRWVAASIGTGICLTLALGCAGTRSGRVTTISAASVAPDDAAMHVNPNAPYMVPGAGPKLIPRSAAMDTSHAGPCNPDVLSVEEIAGDANGIFRTVKLAFMNRGATPCKLGGYPGISLVDAQGETIGRIAVERVTPEKVIAELSHNPPGGTGDPSPEVMLLPHQVAAFQVAWTTGPSCSSVSRIVVTAPGSERAYGIAQPLTVCAGRIQITALRLDEGDV